MATEVEIFNMALARVGAENVGTIEELRGINAQALHDQARDELLQYFPWKFAIARGQLTQAALVTSNIWSFSYAIPADSLRVLSVESDTSGETAEPPWDIEEANIVTNEESSADKIWIRYIKQITTVSLMTMDFVDCWVLLLASRLAIQLSRDKELASELTKEFFEKLLSAFNINMAMGNSLNQSRVEQIIETSFLNLVKGKIKAQQGV